MQAEEWVWQPVALSDPDWQIFWPTLGVLVADWVERHCIVPDGFRRGKPFVMYDWQLWCTVNHYRVRPDAVPAGEMVPDPDAEGGHRETQVSDAFHYRRSQVVAPQKIGKGPWSAAIIAAEGAGPVAFDGWSEPGEVYRCADNGCPCGWVRRYLPGEPRGKPFPTPLIQITATSEDQTKNVYRPLLAMARGPRLAPLMESREGFIRIGRDGRIDMVTSKAQSKLGNPVTFPLQDETGLYTKTNGMIATAETQRRGAAGMGGRSMETTNAWNPAEDSYAQRTAEAAEKVKDIFRYHREPPASLNYQTKTDRQKIHRYVYAGAAHVSLVGIEAEAYELLLKDPAQAERFYGNRSKAGSSVAVDPEAWADRQISFTVPQRGLVTIGIDGARFRDALGIIGTHVPSGHQWPIAIVERPGDAGDDYEHDFELADGPLRDAFEFYDVWRVYVDPGSGTGDISAWMNVWQGRWGEKRIIPWYMHRPRPTAYATRRWVTAVHEGGEMSHPGDPQFSRHVLNAHKDYVNVYDDEGRQMFVLAKEKRGSPLKMDGGAAAVLSWEARGDAIAAGVEEQLEKPKRRMVVFR